MNICKGRTLIGGLEELLPIIFHYIRLWDVSSANRIDHFVTNSKYVRNRVWKTYRRESTVIYPPVDMDSFLMRTKKEDYYFTMTRLESYKRVDLIVEAFTHLKKKLVVVGEGTS